MAGNNGGIDWDALTTDLTDEAAQGIQNSEQPPEINWDNYTSPGDEPLVDNSKSWQFLGGRAQYPDFSDKTKYSDFRRAAEMDREGLTYGMGALGQLPFSLLDTAATGLHGLVKTGLEDLGAGTDWLPSVYPFHGGPLDALRYAGAIGNPSLEPQSTMEKQAKWAMEGLGGGGPIGATMGPLAAVSSTLSGVAGNLLGRNVEDWTQGSPWQHVLSSLAGVVGSLAPGVGMGQASRAYHFMQGDRNSIAQSYDRAGITPRTAASVSDRFLPRFVTTVLGKTAAGGPIHAAAHQEMNDMADSVENLADRMGSATTPEEAGRALNNGAVNFERNFKSTAADLEQEAYNNGIHDNLPVTPSETVQAVTRRMNRFTSRPDLGEMTVPPVFRRIIDSLNDPSLPPPTWDEMRALRTWIGERAYAKTAAGPDTPTEAEWKRLNSAITRDLTRTAEAVGPDAAAAWKRYNDYYAAGSKRLERLGPLLDKSGIERPENLFNYAWGHSRGKAGGGTLLWSIQRAVGPDAWRNMVAVKLRSMGANPDGTFSPVNFVREWGSLSPGARNAITTGTPGLNDALQDLLHIFGNARSIQQMANHANTAGNVHLLGVLSAAGERIVSGDPISAAAIVGGGLGAPWSASKLMTNPAFIRWIATPTSRSALPAHLKILSGLIPQNPEIAEDIRHFISAAEQGPDGGKGEGGGNR